MSRWWLYFRRLCTTNKCLSHVTNKDGSEIVYPVPNKENNFDVDLSSTHMCQGSDKGSKIVTFKRGTPNVKEHKVVDQKTMTLFYLV